MNNHVPYCTFYSSRDNVNNERMKSDLKVMTLDMYDSGRGTYLSSLVLIAGIIISKHYRYAKISFQTLAFDSK